MQEDSFFAKIIPPVKKGKRKKERCSKWLLKVLLLTFNKACDFNVGKVNLDTHKERRTRNEIVYM